ncbi:MAG: hypothetical protein QW727_02525 [Candidatus Pacearchaeota archaeon]
MNKKGDITSTQIVVIIVLIVSFLVILYFFYLLYFNSSIVDKESCHTSVIAKATLPEPRGVRLGDFSLACKTEKVCITTKSLVDGNCRGELGKSYITERVSKNSKENNREINSILADKMAECWAMMGEGKISVFSRELLSGEDELKCVICSRISFDRDSVNEGKIPAKVYGLVEYMLTHKILDRDVSYYEFLIGGNPNFYDDNIRGRDFIKANELAVVFYEGRSNLLLNVIIPTAGITSATIAGAYFGSFIPGVGTVLGAAFGSIFGSVVSIIIPTDGEGEITRGIILMDYNVESLKKIKCTTFENIP